VRLRGRWPFRFRIGRWETGGRAKLGCVDGWTVVVGRWNDQGSPRGAGPENSVIAGQMSERRRNENRKFRDEILSFEDDGAGSVSPRALQSIEEPSIGQFRQTFGRNCRSGGMAD